MTKRHRIQFPSEDVRELRQDEVYFYLLDGDAKEEIRLHDYKRIYEVPGLYEQVVYERLKCQSPSRVSDVLLSSVSQSDQRLSELRVLDLGAGNGIVGEELKKQGVEVRGPVTHAWMPAKSVYFADPDGHALELCAPVSNV